MFLFSLPGYESTGDRLLQPGLLKRGEFSVNRFPNQELYTIVRSAVGGEHCLLLGSIAPPEAQMVFLMMLAHTLKKEGARKVTAVLPYLAYSRHDKDKPGESLAAAWVGSVFPSSGIDEVITVDLHSYKNKQLSSIPITSISTAALFAEAIQQHSLTGATLVAPDNGAVRRCADVKAVADMPCEIVYIEKQRTPRGVVHASPIGEVGSKVVMIDDMLDTGGTLVSACEKLSGGGVNEIHIFVTHGLFTGSEWRKLWGLRVKTIFCTDTIFLRKELASEPIVALSVIPLLQEKLKEVNHYAQGMR